MLNATEQEFIRFATFIKQNYGINLFHKKVLVLARLSNVLESRNIQTLDAYTDFILTTQNADDIDEMLNEITTNHTYFMREEDHFHYLETVILPKLEKRKKEKSLNIWCAGCSFGQEAYCISMILKDYFRKKESKWDTRILATDISQEVLSFADQGVFSSEAVASLPARWVQEYFVYNADNHTYQVTKELRNNIIFKQFNLMSDIEFKVKFDVIFCRNVMIYFDVETKSALIERFYDATNEEGYLCIGHAENISGYSSGYQNIKPAVFLKCQNKKDEN